MDLFLKNNELAQIRAQALTPGSRMNEFYLALSEQAQQAMKTNILDHAGMEWWYCIDRLPNAASVYMVKPEKALGQWIHDSVMTIVSTPADAWVGPWYRPRMVPQRGTLETSIICMALTMTVSMARELFDRQDRELLSQALLEKGLPLLKQRLIHNEEKGALYGNQFIQVLAGLSATAAFLDLRELLPYIRRLYGIAASFYNADSYGEGINYWEYASQHMVLIREFAAQLDETMLDAMDPSAYCSCLPWAATSFLHHKHIPGFEDPLYPLSLNLSDSGYVKRLPANLLLGIAKDSTQPKAAALARWMFDTQYPEGMPTFRTKQMGFMDEVSYWCLLFYAQAAAPMDPVQYGMPLCDHYENGHFVFRSGWQEGATVLAGMGGTTRLGTCGHRHRDNNSFMLNYRKEMLLIDPGCCCYRLDVHKLGNLYPHTHNAVVLLKDGTPLDRKAPFHEAHDGDPYCRTVAFRQEKGMTLYTSDARNAYENTVEKAERTVVLASPKVILLRDRIATDTPVQVQTRFHLNNWNNLLSYELQEAGVTAQRNGVSFRLVQLYGSEPAEMTRKWGVMHLSYHPEPNRDCQGREGSTVDIDYTTEPVSAHSALYAILLDDAALQADGSILADGVRFGIRADETGAWIDTAEGSVSLDPEV